jgi:hypothetical protein
VTLGIFLIGAVVTAMVVGALVLLFYGAVLDGRTASDTPVAPATEPAEVVRLESVPRAVRPQAG